MKSASFRLPLLAFAAAALCAAASATTVATVDMDLAILAHPSTAANRAEMRDMYEKARAERDEMLKRGEDLSKKIREAAARARDEALSEKARKAAEAEARDRMGDIQALEREVRDLVARRRAALRKRELELFNTVMADVKVRIAAIAKDRGADVVLDSSAERASAPVPLVPWTSEAIDITDAVIEATGGDRAAAEAARERAEEFIFGGGDDDGAPALD
ncbi:MAG: OmpH family outer membrane protein [Kiritimatiellae bacterium]|nr:OmpH family outer membrane protein [Kiritimatiellia bacterium]